MTSSVVWTVERFAWWDRDKRRLRRALASGAVLPPWLDITIVRMRRKDAIDDMLREYIFIYAEKNSIGAFVSAMPRRRRIRVLRARGVRVVRASLHSLVKPAGRNGTCPIDGAPGVHYHVTTVRKDGTGLVSFPIERKRDLVRFTRR